MAQRVDPYKRGRQLYRFYVDFTDDRSNYGFTKEDLEYMNVCLLRPAEPNEEKYLQKWTHNMGSLVKSREWWRREMRHLHPQHSNNMPRRRARVREPPQARARNNTILIDEPDPASAVSDQLQDQAPDVQNDISLPPVGEVDHRPQLHRPQPSQDRGTVRWARHVAKTRGLGGGMARLWKRLFRPDKIIDPVPLDFEDDEPVLPPAPPPSPASPLPIPPENPPPHRPEEAPVGQHIPQRVAKRVAQRPRRYR